ncbi:TonB-dependent receptor [Candidatus Symbiobacter mobilis]|nr:TonB-dependent receptor [Candidatus Symbiobacter mobilis]
MKFLTVTARARVGARLGVCCVAASMGTYVFGALTAQDEVSEVTKAVPMAVQTPQGTTTTQAVVPVLREVRIQARVFDDPPESLPVGVSVLTRQDIERSGAQTVNEALQKLLGVPGRADFYGGGDYALDLRGFGATASNNQVIVVDGVRINEADLGGTRLAGIPIDMVESIEVLRGSGAVPYGEGATGGVILITTRSGRDPSPRAQLATAVGSHGLRDVRAGATVVAGDWSLDAHGARREADNHRAHFRSENDAASAQLQWSNDWLRWGLGTLRDEVDTQLPGALTAAQYRADPTQSTALPGDQARIRNARTTVFAQAELEGWQLGLDAAHRTKELDSEMSNYPYHYDIDADTLSLRAHRESQWGMVRNAMTIGNDHVRWARVVRGGGQVRQHSHGLSMQGDWFLPTDRRVFAGYRQENVARIDDILHTHHPEREQAWELGAAQGLEGGYTVFARVGSSFRLANADEMGYTLANTLLQPQTARDAELGLRWAGSHGRREARIYRSKVQREIGFDPTVPNPQPWNLANLGANVNFDPIVRQGVELDIRHALTSTWTVQAALALRQAEFAQGPHQGRTVPLVARNTLGLGVDWQPMAAHAVHLGAAMVSGQYVDFGNTCTIPGHAVFDLRYRYRTGKVEATLGVDNLFDTRYATQAFQCANGETQGIYPEAGRTLSAGLRVGFW